MNVSKLVKNCQKGVTLLELLISLSILSIVLLTFMNFFYQASKFNLSNQNETVALNIARNALKHVGNQNFIELRHYFKDSLNGEPDAANIHYYLRLCNDQYSLETTMDKCDPIVVNSSAYNVSVYAEEAIDTASQKYYIPVRIEVTWGSNGEAKLDGTVKSEDLR
jgi:prepilin-type N-terminal cleavage/methylation domain-containing protein